MGEGIVGLDGLAAARIAFAAGGRVESRLKIRLGGHDDVDTLAQGVWLCLVNGAWAVLDRKGDDERILLGVMFCKRVARIVVVGIVGSLVPRVGVVSEGVSGMD